ncbi:hypothetical protein IFM89_002195 [Coptis chinensis]|uniref:Uncharacterized protein n=1 Tax=Coptis chinensis TaxID=261450 RepID=A0A835I8M2_9MAGN|nr:hypothetical protein IFM89_002195 [Coptis chinensis]
MRQNLREKLLSGRRNISWQQNGPIWPQIWTPVMQMYSNRSLCYALLKGEVALADANACINMKPEWPRGYYRAGAA